MTMTDWTNTEYARAALADPRLPASELAAITAVQPTLWPQVAAHPAAYPDLLGWLAAQGVPMPGQHPAPAPVPEPAPVSVVEPVETAATVPDGSAPAAAPFEPVPPFEPAPMSVVEPVETPPFEPARLSVVEPVETTATDVAEPAPPSVVEPVETTATDAFEPAPFEPVPLAEPAAVSVVEPVETTATDVAEPAPPSVVEPVETTPADSAETMVLGHEEPPTSVFEPVEPTVAVPSMPAPQPAPTPQWASSPGMPPQGAQPPMAMYPPQMPPPQVPQQQFPPQQMSQPYPPHQVPQQFPPQQMAQQLPSQPYPTQQYPPQQYPPQQMPPGMPPGGQPPAWSGSAATLPAMPPAPAKPRKRHTGLIIGIAAAVVVIVAGVLVITLLTNQTPASWQPSRVRTVPPGQAPQPGVPSVPAATDEPQSEAPTAPAPAPSLAGQDQVPVVPGETPVAIAPGEMLFSGPANMGSDYSVNVGFILSADGTSIHNVTVSVTGGDLQSKYGFSKITQTTTQPFDISSGAVDVQLADGVSLSVALAGDMASGSLTYSAQVGGFNGGSAQTLNLGTGFFSLQGS